MDSFREQRAADLARASSRPHAIDVARKTRGLLGRYVSSRRAQAVGDEPVTVILWGRVALAVSALALVALGVVRLLR